MNQATIWDVVDENPLLKSVDAFTPIANVLNDLKEWNVNTVALKCTPGAAKEFVSDELIINGEQYLGFVSVLDLLLYVMQGSDPDIFLKRPVIKALGSTREGMRMWLEPYETSLQKAIQPFIKECHHAIGFDKEHFKVSPKMISQLDIISYLHRNFEKLGIQQIVDKPVSEIMTTNGVTVKLTDSMIDSFMFLQRYRALPVVDNSGRLISTISVSDFTGAAYLDLAASLPIGIVNYLLYRHSGTLPTPITMTSNESIFRAMDLMLKNGIHRIYVVASSEEGSGDEKRLVGVVSCTDVLKAFLDPHELENLEKKHHFL